MGILLVILMFACVFQFALQIFPTMQNDVIIIIIIIIVIIVKLLM